VSIDKRAIGKEIIEECKSQPFSGYSDDLAKLRCMRG